MTVLHACLDCAAPSDRPRCPACRHHRERRRPNAAARGYGHHHRKARAETLRLRPWCKCGQPATQIHHLDGDQHNLDPSNLQPICAACHGQLEATERRTRDEDGRWAA